MDVCDKLFKEESVPFKNYWCKPQHFQQGMNLYVLKFLEVINYFYQQSIISNLLKL